MTTKAYNSKPKNHQGEQSCIPQGTTTMTTTNEREFRRFKRWLFSLDKETLLDAMAFTFQSTTTTTMMTANNSSLVLGNPLTGSHEYDLLVEMVKLQPPPSTPVHPRAMGYKPRASQYGPKLDYHLREEDTLRWTQPRLFQWCDVSENNTHNHNNEQYAGDYEFDNRSNTKHRHQQKVQRHLLPKQQRISSSKQQQQPQRFNVVARKKITPWGECYSLGCTQEQQEADVLIVLGTRLGTQKQRQQQQHHQQPQKQGEKVVEGAGIQHTACFVMDDDEINRVMGKRKNNNNDEDNKKNDKDDGVTGSLSPERRIVRMLQIASRGHFLQSPSDRKQSIRNIGIRKEGLYPPSYCAPWLEPTERWFSLSFYLASRYCVALWDTYHQYRSGNRLVENGVDSSSPGPSQQSYQQHDQYPPMERIPCGMQIRYGDWDKYDPKILQVVLVRAIQMGFHDLLTMELQEKHMNTNYNFLRDGVLWSLLQMDTTMMVCQQSSSPRMLQQDIQQMPYILLGRWEAVVQSWTQIPLLEIHSVVQNKFRSLVCQKLEEQLVAEIERVMYREEELDLASKGIAKQVVGTTRGRTLVSSQRGSRKIKKKKPKRSKRKQGQKITPSNSPLPAIPAGSEEESDTDDDGDDASGEPERRRTEARGRQELDSVDFPSSVISPRDRNRNMILVLGILDDVMEDVYSKVGLPPTPAFVEVNRETVITSVSSLGTAKRGKYVKPKGDDKTTPVLNITRKDPKRLQGSPASAPVTASDVSLPHNLAQLDPPLHLRDSQNPWRVPVSIEQKALDYRHRSDLSDVSTSSVHSRQNAGLPADFYAPFIVERDLIFGVEHSSNTGGGEDIWSFVNRYQSRERSILTDFFLSRDSIFDTEDGNDDDDDERLMAASTAASISSSNYKDTTLVPDADDLDDGSVVVAEAEELAHTTIAIAEDSTFSADMVAIREVESDSLSDGSHNVGDSEENSVSSLEVVAPTIPDDYQVESAMMVDSYIKVADQTNQSEDEEVANATSETNGKDDSSTHTATCRSPSPEAPITPPPTLSPILVSLADLKDLKRKASPPELPSSLKIEKSRQLVALAGPGSLPNSPIPPQKSSLSTSWSRDDLRIETCRDDFSIKQHRKSLPAERKISLETPTYKSIAVKSLARPIASSKSAGVDFRTQVLEASLRRQNRNRDSCAQSETAAEGQREEQQSFHREEVENQSITRDETTTITSGVSQRGETEEIATIREERNAFRDMCLTLGAEVAKLRVMLSAQQATAVAPMDYPDAYNYQMYRPGSFDPNGMQPFYHGMNNGLRPGPMSDAGFHRGGDHESQISEDEMYDSLSNNVRENRVDSIRQMSSSHTIGGSDASIDFNNSNQGLTGGHAVGQMPMYDNIHFHGFQSRLTKDILRFLDASSLQLRKLSRRRKLAVERFSRLVKTIWPRSQVKLYGSYVTGLCLPSSDLDFVVCLPAVHKKDLALAPGVLEGRNAINETSQKLLARELKGESWIDPRSIKLIERTVVPVIKVSTKDTRARMIQLDISFDSPEHHGLEANQMVGRILEELPLIRPLMLVLKQFLLDRGLLTAYTGGLSSYCLFLMVARYLQEQPPLSGDCGSLLMGFLDFYGNSFDPRVTGVSFRRRQYFARPNYALTGYETSGQRMWTQHQPHQQHVVTDLPVIPDNPINFRRQSDTGSVDGTQRRKHSFTTTSTHRFVSRSIPPRHKEMDHRTPLAHPVPAPGSGGGGTPAFDHARPFTFDPLYVEDPLSSGNNVGRNAFRINQVQRAFSDAHRALVASLEWDIHSSVDGVQVDYPLLKCLLQGEDVLYEL